MCWTYTGKASKTQYNKAVNRFVLIVFNLSSDGPDSRKIIWDKVREGNLFDAINSLLDAYITLLSRTG